jgi:CRISPR-associated protein Csc3
MAKKRKQSKPETEQLSLFDLTPTPENPEDNNIEDNNIDVETDNYDEFDPEDIGYDDLGFTEESSDRTIETPSELLTLKLLRQAIVAQNPDDVVMADFGEYVLPNLLRVAIGVTAKGGKYFDKIDQQREAAGKEKIRRDNAGDQSLNTHLLNGLFPANLIERRLQQFDTTVRRLVKERDRRLLVAGFILHDFEKFNYDLFPEMPEKYRAIRRDFTQDIRKLSLEEHREIISVIVRELGINQLIDSSNPESWLEYLDDLLCIAYNAQAKSDTNLNLSVYGLQPKLRDKTLGSLADLTRIADLMASVIKHPQDAEHQTLNEILHKLSDGNLRFTYHQISENRGVLTNVVNNALIEAYEAMNTEECRYYQPLLYLPTGVIYLAMRQATAIPETDIPQRVVNKIKQLCSGQLRRRQTGFGRDGKGMKYAEYYSQFFDDIGLMEVGLSATLRILYGAKASVAKSRSDNLVKFQEKQILSPEYDFRFEDDIRIDQIAEFGDLVTRKIWGERVVHIEKLCKQNKQNKQNQQKLPELPDLVAEVAKFWQLSAYLNPIREIQRINESLKEHKLKGNTGGVPYEWYYLAAKYIQQNPGLEDVRDTCETLIKYVANLIQPILNQYQLPDGWDDLRDWVKRVVILPGKTSPITQNAEVFLDELDRYQLAKKPGRGRQLICSISHSPYTVTEQMESAVLFTPQVYTNKQMLGGSNAKRNISSIAGTEMMLRQILMNQTQAVGKRFEDGNYRYLYFYPTYYFTPETNKFLQAAYTNISQTRFTAPLRNHFITKEWQAKFDRTQYQTVDSFLIDEQLDREKDRTFKLSYPEDEPLTFYFIALPPGKDAKDTESWVMPSWLAFAFPMILDVKTVVSESPIPPFNDGSEFEETVFLDSAPQAIQALTQRDRFRLDYILEGWEENQQKYPAPLNVLTAAYAIHLDVNAKQGKGGYDANWGKLVELATDFQTSPLYVFNYLNRWVRRQGVDTARIDKIKLYAYAFYPCFDPYVKVALDNQEDLMSLEIKSPESPLNHPKKLTELYRQFYRANKQFSPQSNAVLKPIDIAANTILNADPSFQGEALVDAVAAEVCKLMDRVHSSNAEGRWIFNSKERDQERQAVLEFARYFVVEVFEKSFAGDRGRLAGRQINLIRDTCEFLYRLAQDKENEKNKENQESNEDN